MTRIGGDRPREFVGDSPKFFLVLEMFDSEHHLNTVEKFLKMKHAEKILRLGNC